MKIPLPNLRKGWAVALVLLCFSHLALTQDRSIRGTVTDGESNDVLPGVNVLVKGTTIGTITDVEGKYILSVPEDARTLVFSSVGYSSQEVQINGRSTVNLTLMPDIQALSEVVVVGYGTQEKRDVTAAIASLDKEQINKIPVPSGIQAMQGQVAGVDIQAQGGRPGQNATVQIRGRRSISASNEPLYVIDGIPQTSESSAIFDINPQDIESMEVLKDAAATAIYGSRGANGVILITTKRGSSGKTTVSYDGYYGVTSPIVQVDMMNGEEFAAMKRESRRWDPETRLVQYDGELPPDELVFEDPIELESLAQGRSTDYQDLVLGDGWQTNHQLSVAGGNASTQFNISLGYFDEQGVISNMDFQRLTARINLDHKINEIFKVGTSMFTSLSIQNWGSNATMGEAISNNPLGVPYDADGNLRFLPTNDGIRTNPLSELVENAYVDERRINRIFVPVYVEANIAEGLKYRANIGPDIRMRRRGLFRASETNNNRGGPADAMMANQTDVGYTIENILTYEKEFGGIHNLRFTALQSIQGLRMEEDSTQVENLPYESQLFYNLGTAEVKGDLASRLEEWTLASYMGRINYELAGKYLFQATLRADGSSRLAAGNKWAFFPGLSAGWRIKDEDFMSNLNFLSELKLRASYGAVGNTSVSPYQTFGRLQRTTYAWDENPAFGFRLDEIPNADLGWEISSTVDVGFDFGFFNNRLSGSFDWFRTNTTDMLLERNLPFTSGYQNILQNVGATRTSGLELGLNAVIMDRPNGFSWTTNVNISTVNEEIVELALTDENGNPIDDVGNRWFIGEPLRVFFDYEKEGIYQLDEVDLARDRENKLPGEIKLVDQPTDNDGDGIIDEPDGRITPADRVILGSDVPDFFGGITNNFSYKGFDLSFFFFYRVGHMIRSRFHDSNNTLFARYNNLDVDYWTIDNPTNESPRPNQNQERPRNGSTLTYFDGSFVKLRNVTFGYNFPKSITESIGLSRLRVYASAQNPWFWSRFETFDPENNDDINSGDVPSNRLFLMGVNVSF
jgi:TonB-linked SusC/RagA family outer membrane protein